MREKVNQEGGRRKRKTEEEEEAQRKEQEKKKAGKLGRQLQELARHQDEVVIWSQNICGAQAKVIKKGDRKGQEWLHQVPEDEAVDPWCRWAIRNKSKLKAITSLASMQEVDIRYGGSNRRFDPWNRGTH